MTKKKKFGAGLEELDNPMPSLKKNWFDDDSNRISIEEYNALEGQKMVMLQMHYGLQLGDYLGLSLALAHEHVRGFQSTRKGRRIKWDMVALGYLFVDVKRKIKQLELNEDDITAAASAVAKQPHWEQFLGSNAGLNITPDPSEAIRKAFYSSANNNKCNQMMWKAYCYHEETKTVDEWDVNVAAKLKETSENEIN